MDAQTHPPLGRAVYKAAVRFGGVGVPVKLYTALDDVRIHFRLLHDDDSMPLRQEMMCPVHEEPVPREHRVKGYEVGPDEFVVLEPDDLRDLRPESERTIEVLEFVGPDEVDARYCDRTYYLGPDGREKAYAALTAAVARAGRVGICRWVMRNRSYLGALSAGGSVLRLVTVRYGDEVVHVDDLDLPRRVSVREKERQTAEYLVAELGAPFEPESYRDEHAEAVRDLIRRKAEGEEITLVEPEEKAPTEDDELLETLEKSLELARAGGA